MPKPIGFLLSLDQEPGRVQAYAKLAGPAIQAGGKYLVPRQSPKVRIRDESARVLSSCRVQQAPRRTTAGYQEALSTWPATWSSAISDLEAWLKPPPGASPTLLKERENHPGAPPRAFAAPLLKGEGKKMRTSSRRRRAAIRATGISVCRFRNRRVCRFVLLLLPDRFFRELREARFDFGGQRSLRSVCACSRTARGEAGVGIFVSLAHLGEHARGQDSDRDALRRRERAAYAEPAVR